MLNYVNFCGGVGRGLTVFLFCFFCCVPTPNDFPLRTQQLSTIAHTNTFKVKHSISHWLHVTPLMPQTGSRIHTQTQAPSCDLWMFHVGECHATTKVRGNGVTIYNPVLSGKYTHRHTHTPTHTHTHTTHTHTHTVTSPRIPRTLRTEKA